MMCLRIMLKPHALANSMSYLVRGRVGAGVKGRVGVGLGSGLGLLSYRIAASLGGERRPSGHQPWSRGRVRDRARFRVRVRVRVRVRARARVGIRVRVRVRVRVTGRLRVRDRLRHAPGRAGRAGSEASR